MENSTIYSHTIGLNLQDFDRSLEEELRKNVVFPAHIPEYKLDLESRPIWRLGFARTSHSNVQVDIENKCARLELPEYGVWDIVKLGNLLWERTLQESGLYKVHASAFEIGGRGVMIIGDAMAGKSTLVIEALGRYHANLIGAEFVTLTSDGTLAGGTKVIGARADAFLRFHGDLKHLTKGIHNQKIMILDAESMCVKNANNIPLDLIIYPKITVNEAFELYLLEKKQKKELLFDKIGFSITGTYAIADQSMALPSLDTAEIKESRLKATINIAQHTKAVMVAGTPRRILEEIVNLLA